MNECILSFGMAFRDGKTRFVSGLVFEQPLKQERYEQTKKQERIQPARFP